MDDAWAVKGNWHEQVGAHLIYINSDEEVSVLQVPKNILGISTEVGDHNAGIGDWVVESSLASGVKANDSSALTVRENFGNLLLHLVLDKKSLILNQVVHKFAISIKHDQERIDDVELDDW